MENSEKRPDLPIKNKLGLYVAPHNNNMGKQPNSPRTVGYCHNQKHHGALSVKMIKQHQCLGKQCPYLEKIENHPYWKNRAEIKEKKKEAEKAKKAELDAIFNTNKPAAT